MNAAESEAPAAKKRSKKLDGPGSTLVALVAAVLVAGGLLANAVLGYSWALEARTRQMHGEAVAAQLSAALSAYRGSLQARADRLAQDVTPDGTPVPAEASQTGTPAAHTLQFVPLDRLGIAAPSFDPAKLHGNMEVDLVGETFKGNHVPGEIFGDGDQWLLVVAARVGPVEGAARGVLLLRARIDAALREVLLPPVPQGQFELLTRSSDGSLRTLASGGSAPAPDAPLYLASTPFTSLQAGFRPSPEWLQASGVTGTGLLLPVLGGSVLLALLMAIGFRQLRSQLREDAERLSDAALYQRAATATVPTLHFSDLLPAGEAIVRLRRERTDAPSRRSREEEPAPAPAATSAPDALQIEIVDELPDADITFEAEKEMAVPAEIFRDYDIRGLEKLLEPELACAIGRAIGSEAHERGCNAIVVGADGRGSSPMLREQLVKGLLESGLDVIDVGTVATPMLYYACHHLGTQSGVMVTGSHHPASHNGFKIMLAGETLCGERITALRTRILEKRFREGQGGYRVTEINADYQRAVCDDVLVDRRFKVVVDCGNGAASVIAVELLQQLGCDVVPLFCELDGRFPNHAPDPSVPGNLRKLIAEVATHRADLGIAFDGDADRIGVVSSSGMIVAADRLLMLFAQELLSRHPGADVVFDVKCSRDLANVIARQGGRPIMWRSGHSWIKQKMKETGALLGGEFTGHICFKDRWFGFDDALYAAARLLEVMSSEQKPLDELLATLPHSVGTPEIHVPVPEPLKFALMGALAENISLEGARLTRIDGVRAEYPDGWGLVRASNTSPALVLRFEGQDENALARIEATFRAELKRVLPDVAVPA